MRETAVEAHLIRRVAELGGRQAKFVVPGENGHPDRLIVLSGCPTAFLELKAPGEVPREDQLERIAEWQRAGAGAGWADPAAKVEGFLRQLRRMGGRHA